MNPVGYPNDIALLRLKQPADWMLTRVKMDLGCLPPESIFEVAGKECWITGWGLTSCKNNTFDVNV